MSFISLALYFLCVIGITLCHASLNGYPSKSHKSYYSKDYLDPGVCLQEAVCELIPNTTCFGTTLPYAFTSVALAEDSNSQFEVQDNLALWQGLKSVPRCWALVQPLLCAVYMPKCENGSVFLPSQEMCRITRGPCKAVEVKHAWPSFLRCENKKLFPPRCRNPLQEVKFNTSYKCVSPLVETDNPDNWFNEVEGCGIQCQDPFFTKEEHETVHVFICVLATICFSLTCFTVITFGISWKVSNFYPAVIIFYINLCLAVASFGWLIQFFPGARKEIVCLHDGTIRRKQPRSGEHLCTITFFLIYFFLMAAIVWFVILAYAWNILFRKYGVLKDVVKSKVAYFHLAAWSVPLVLTVIIMALTEVDGDSMSGICFVGYANQSVRLLLLLVPVGAASVIGGFFLARSLYTLTKLKSKSGEVTNVPGKKRIQKMIVKIGFFSAFAAFFIISTFACHAYDFMYRKEWETSLREYIVCLATNAASPYSNIAELPSGRCVLKSKPRLFVILWHLSSFFGFGIFMSAWVWTRATLESWKRFFYGLCAPKERRAVLLKRHKVIAKAFNKRHEIDQGHVSFSLNSTHEDPIEMNVDVISVASREISSSWAAALPQFLMRRNAVAAEGAFVPRHYSSASDVSRHISLDSFNQPNVDSLSMQISEQDYVRHQRRKTRKERRRFLNSKRIAAWFPGSRRSSDTSLQSSIVVASIAAAAAKNATLAAAQVTKSTSTRDLGPDAIVVRQPSIVLPNRALIQRQAMPNPPFTHGMTDNSHRLNGRLSAVAGSNASQSFTPIPLQTNHLGMVPPVYGPGYGLGYMGNLMYPGPSNGMFSGYAQQNDLNYGNYNGLTYVPYGAFPSAADALLCQYHLNLPLHPRVDSGSEPDFFPIIMSDSEVTDTGHRSYDEVYNTQRLLQERVAQQFANTQERAAQQFANTQAAAAEMVQPKPVLEPQTCAKTQHLKRMGSFDAKTTTAMAAAPLVIHSISGRKSPHSEAPPPSPAESIKSYGELDDVFLKEPLSTPQQPAIISSKDKANRSSSSLHKPEADSFMKRIKSKLKRATSFSSQNATGSETIELAPKQCHSSLGQLSLPKSKNRATSHDLTGKKSQKCAEGGSLLPTTEASENVSR